MILLKHMNTQFEKFEESLIFEGDPLSELQSDIKRIKVKNKEIKTDNVRLQARIKELEKEMPKMGNTINREECLVKRNNVVIFGLEKSGIQVSTREVIKICKNLKFWYRKTNLIVKFCQAEMEKRNYWLNLRILTLRIK
ncbi:hypothetical protein WA026_001792 [Henosepilachna vigintioctopunctata]|uniref:Uncharacterized protein n=1 Tax=Henosepilachna vigintioctopunctata TaxID=420089 RepID=A0AAW1UVL5_9CUCU